MAFTYRNAHNGDTTSSDTARPDLIAEGNWTLISDTLDAAAIAAVAALNAARAPEVAAAALRAGVAAMTQPVSGTVTAATPPATVTSTALTGSSQVISATAKDYRGFTVRETAGAAAVVVLWDNASAASGTIIEQISLVASESAREYYGPAGGVKTVNGIYCQVVSGAVAGSVRTS